MPSGVIPATCCRAYSAILRVATVGDQLQHPAGHIRSAVGRMRQVPTAVEDLYEGRGSLAGHQVDLFQQHPDHPGVVRCSGFCPLLPVRPSAER